jgi:methylated-DNA-protein-cysteine methyltransferase-like protein
VRIGGLGGREAARRRAAPGETGFFEQVYALVEQIPPGRVATYGQLAALLGTPRGARAVGWALRALGASRAKTIPWHRVVGAGGRISLRAGTGPIVQRRRLRAEGVRFHNDRIDLTEYGVLNGRR